MEKLSAEINVNNALNTTYFTRRASGYPGPGILPSDPRNVTFSLGWVFNLVMRQRHLEYNNRSPLRNFFLV